MIGMLLSLHVSEASEIDVWMYVQILWCTFTLFFLLILVFWDFHNLFLLLSMLCVSFCFESSLCVCVCVLSVFQFNMNFLSSYYL